MVARRHVPPLSVRCHWNGRAARVTVCGEVDFATVGILSQRLSEAAARQPGRLVIDLNEEGHIDFADRPDVGLNATETPVSEQFGNEFIEPLASLLCRHLFQAAHAPVVGDQLAKAQGG